MAAQPGAMPTPGPMHPQRAPYDSFVPAGESGAAPQYGNTYQPWAQGGGGEEDPFAQGKRRRMMIGVSVAAMVAAALLAFGAVAFLKEGGGRVKPSPSANGADSADPPTPSGPLSYAPTGLRFDGGVYVFSNPTKPPATAVTAPATQVIDPNFQWPPPQNATGKDAGGAATAKDAGANGASNGTGGGETDSGATIELW
jgi:hypothetical protein